MNDVDVGLAERRADFRARLAKAWSAEPEKIGQICREAGEAGPELLPDLAADLAKFEREWSAGAVVRRRERLIEAARSAGARYLGCIEHAEIALVEVVRELVPAERALSALQAAMQEMPAAVPSIITATAMRDPRRAASRGEAGAG